MSPNAPFKSTLAARFGGARGQVSAALVAALVTIGCRTALAPSRTEDPAAGASRLAREAVVLDTHIDLPERLQEKMEDVCGATPDGNFDFPRAKAGGLGAAFMAIYIDAEITDPAKARERADRLIDLVEGIVARCPDRFAIARSPEEVRRIVASGRIALPMGMENGSPLGDDLANLERFRRRGIRYVTLTHAENNGIADSSFASGRKWHGLSPFGKKVVAEMNRLGIMVDVSHLSDEAFRDTLDVSTAPVIASHSSCRAFTPDFERNLADDQILRIAERGGVVQINFGSMFLRGDARKQSSEAWSGIRKYLAEHKLAPESDEAKLYRASYWKEHPRIFGDVSDVVAHVDHVVKIAGVDHVGLGSDFEGVGAGLPAGLKDVSGYPNLIRALLEKGYSENDVRKICGENLLRVWAEVERVAAGSVVKGRG